MKSHGKRPMTGQDWRRSVGVASQDRKSTAVNRSLFGDRLREQLGC